MIAVIVCGSRHWADAKPIHAALTALDAIDELVVIEGNAAGADRLAGEWAQRRTPHVGHETYPANWEQLGRRAGYERNAQMLERLKQWQAMGAEVAVLAFKSAPDPDLARGGTEHMAKIAHNAGIRVGWFPEPPKVLRSLVG